MLSTHLSLEIAAIDHRGKPLEPGEAVPGCTCRNCTGLDADGPEILRGFTPARGPSEEWTALVDRARSASIIEVAARLGCGEPKKAGSRGVVVRCPLHADKKPSMSVDPSRGVWYCFPCGEGGDAIQLVQRARRCDFKAAVRELAG